HTSGDALHTAGISNEPAFTSAERNLRSVPCISGGAASASPRDGISKTGMRLRRLCCSFRRPESPVSARTATGQEPAWLQYDECAMGRIDDSYRNRVPVSQQHTQSGHGALSEPSRAG